MKKIKNKSGHTEVELCNITLVECHWHGGISSSENVSFIIIFFLPTHSALSKGRLFELIFFREDFE